MWQRKKNYTFYSLQQITKICGKIMSSVTCKSCSVSRLFKEQHCQTSVFLVCWGWQSIFHGPALPRPEVTQQILPHELIFQSLAEIIAAVQENKSNSSSPLGERECAAAAPPPEYLSEGWLSRCRWKLPSWHWHIVTLKAVLDVTVRHDNANPQESDRVPQTESLEPLWVLHAMPSSVVSPLQPLMFF